MTIRKKTGKGFRIYTRKPFPDVIPARFERATHSLEGCCSIQLSYGTIACIAWRPCANCGCKDRKSFLFFIGIRRPNCGFGVAKCGFLQHLFCRAEYFPYICRLKSPKG